MILRRFVFAATVIVVLGVLFFAPITVPHTLELTGRIAPGQEWVLTQGPDGQLQTRTTNHLNGAVTAWSIAEVERGDAVTLDWAPGLWERSTITAGDTLATLRAARRTIEEARLEGALAVAQANVQALASGEKEAVVEEARQQRLQALAERDQQQRIVERLRTLRTQNLVAEEEVEVAENVLSVLMLRVEEAEARLEAVQVGAKPEDVALARVQVQALEAELAALRVRLARDHIVAPLSGKMLRSFAPDTLLHIADTTTFAVVFPIALSMHVDVAVGRTVEIAGMGVPVGASATILHVSEQAFTRGGQTFVVATAQLDQMDAPIVIGAFVQSRLHIADVSLGQYLTTILFGES